MAPLRYAAKFAIWQPCLHHFGSTNLLSSGDPVFRDFISATPIICQVLTDGVIKFVLAVVDGCSLVEYDLMTPTTIIM